MPSSLIQLRVNDGNDLVEVDIIVLDVLYFHKFVRELLFIFEIFICW